MEVTHGFCYWLIAFVRPYTASISLSLGWFFVSFVFIVNH